MKGLPKIVITDIDGVWTDGGMYYSEDGNEWKKFNTSDSAGVLWCRLNNIPVAIVTGEKTELVKRRADKLKVDHLFMGVKNKVETVKDLLEELNIDWHEVAYIGDDINDYKLIQKVGYSACPANAPDYIKKITNDVIDVNGGDGAFRAFVEKILNDNDVFQETLDSYLDQ